MVNLDSYLFKVYDRKNYNCLHFARDVWLELTGDDVTVRIASLLDPVSRTVRKENVLSFRRLDKQLDPCFVLMRKRRAATHIGVYVGGRVIHIQETGVEYQPLEVATRGFESMRYYV